MTTGSKLTFEQVLAEAQKRQLVLSRDPTRGFRLDIDPQSGLSWRDFPSMVAENCKKRFETLGYVMNCLRLIDKREDYDQKALAIAQDAKQWLIRTDRSPLPTDEMIQRLLESAIRRIPDLRRGEIEQYNEQAGQRLQQWISVNGILTGGEACQQAGFFIRRQLETACAFRMIRIARSPADCRLQDATGAFVVDAWFTRPLTVTETPDLWDTDYYHPFELTLEQIQTINQETLVSRQEAAEILTVSEQQFDQLKKEYGIQHAREQRSRRNQQMYYLYRLADVFQIDTRLREIEE